MIPNPTSELVERLALMVGFALVSCFIFTTVAPYYIEVPQASIRLIDQQQTILQSLMLVLVGYLWGNSAGNKSKDNTIESLAKTAQNAAGAGDTQAATPPESQTKDTP